ncbi:MAG: hypothetical protein ACOCWR_10620 [Oceanidesulfovibrio sp.]
MRTIIAMTLVAASLLLAAGPARAQNATGDAQRRDNYLGTFPDSGSMVIESGPGQDTVIQSRSTTEDENRTEDPPLIIVPEIRLPVKDSKP